MEVEVKLRLPSADDHERLAHLLLPYHKAHYLQENVFFDGRNGELSDKRAVLRLRFYGGDDARCVVSIKGKAVIVDGISRATEEEEEIGDVATARACVAEPGRLSSLDSALLRKAAQNFHIQEFVCLGGFRNVRNVYAWEGLTLELDETQFSFGTAYEIECETSDPVRARSLLESFLSQHAIPFSYSKVSKFAVFRSGTLQ